MSLVNCTDICLSFGPQAVFDSLGLVIYPGEHVGLVGPNGCGKTTLLRLITGEIQPESGAINRGRNLSIGYLPQEPLFEDARTVMEEMHAGFEEVLQMQRRLERLSRRMAEFTGDQLQAVMREYDRLQARFEVSGGYEYEIRIKSILAGVGLGEELFNVPTTALSGGQKSRLGLAKVLAAETQLLLLDEPTNHLDLQATEWLERFLQGYDGAAVIISHDRYLLDNVVCKIIEIDRRRARVWKGNYSNYARTKETVALHQQRTWEARREMVQKTLDFIARNKDQEGMRGTARGRKTRLERLLKENPDFLERPAEQQRIDFSFGKVNAKGDIAIRCEDLKMGFEELELFQGLAFELEPGDRLGITGPNGTGKSTLLKLILGKLAPLKGHMKVAPSATLGYLDQAGAEVNPENTVLEELALVRPDMLHGQLRNRLGAFLFHGDDVFKKVGDLSGGERNRLLLCKLVLTEPDILLLDEPTNHLDIASRETLEAALMDYEGTLVVVSHDRFFLDRVADELLVIGADELARKKMGCWELIEGGYTEYAALVRRRIDRAAAAAQNAKTAATTRRKNPAKRTTPEELRQFNRLTVEQIEEKVMAKEDRIHALQQQFGDESVYKNPEQLARLNEELNNRKAELELLYRAYEWRMEA